MRVIIPNQENKKFFMETHIAGVMYHNAADVWDQLSIGTPLLLEREKDNRYDPEAIAVYFLRPVERIHPQYVKGAESIHDGTATESTEEKPHSTPLRMSLNDVVLREYRDFSNPCELRELQEPVYLAIKIGYVPRAHNASLALFLDMGYQDLFEARICKIDPEAHPEQQLRMSIKLLRKKE